MGLVNVSNLQYPLSIQPNTAFKITGQVNFPLPLWIVAEVQSGGAFNTGIGSTLKTSNAIALGGKFTINFPEGFTSEGTWYMRVNVYLGPTTEISPSIAGAAKAISIPPFPALTTTEQKTFQVSSSAQYGSISNAVITDWTTPVNVGETCTVTVSLNYAGPEQQVQLYAALGNDRGAFDTMGSAITQVTLPASASAQPLTFTIDVPVLSATVFSGSPYDIYVKIGNYDKIPRLFDKVVVNPSGGGGTEGSLSVTNSPVAQGSTAEFSGGNFTPFVSVSMYVVGQSGVSIASVPTNLFGGFVGSFIANLTPGTYTLMAVDSSNSKSTTATFTVTASGGGGGAQLVIDTNYPYQGTNLGYIATGFMPNTLLHASITDNSNNELITQTLMTNSNGYASGSIFLPGSMPTGTYKIVVSDGTNSVSKDITVKVSSGGGGSSVVRNFYVDMAALPTGTSYYQIYYYDPVQNKFIQGLDIQNGNGVIPVGDRANFSQDFGMYTGGYPGGNCLFVKHRVVFLL